MLIAINKRLTKHVWTYLLLVLSLLLVSHIANAQNVTSDVQIEKDTLIVGSEQDYPPFATGMTDETAGGFTVDLWKAVASEAGLKYTIHVRPFHELLKEFREGKIDILINLATSKERHQFADFTVPHAVIHGGIFVRKGESKINSEADLVGKSIILLDADLAHDYAVSKGLSKQLILVDTAAEGMKLLASGKHDAMLISKLAGMQTLKKLGINNINALKVNADFEQKFTFAVQKGHSELLDKLNEALSMLKSNGTYSKLYEKWFGVYEIKEVTLVDILKYLLPVLIVFFAIALFSIHRRRIERRAARKILQESEAHLRLSQTVGGIGTWQADLVNHTQYWSENCISLLGFPPLSNPTWEDFLNIVHPEDRQRVIDATQAHIERGKKFDVEYRAVSANGQIRWMRSSGQVEHDATGKPIAMRGIAQDISERKLLNIALADKELHFRTLLSTTPVGVFESDSKGECIYINECWSKITGLSFELAKGNGWIKALHPEDRDRVYAEWTSAVAENRAFHLEYRFLRPDGNEIWVLGQSVDFKNSAGKLGYIGSITDIHQQKLAEKGLIESENHARAIIESSPVPLALIDTQGNITYLNTAFTQTLGYTLSDIPTFEDWWPLAYPDAQYRHAVIERWQVNLDEVKLNNRPFKPMEINVWCKDNLIRTFMCSASDIHGNFGGNQLVTMYDITERKQAELEIKKMRHALVESQERYVDLYEFAPVGYLSLNKHGLITEVNWKITALFGLHRKELNHHRLAEFVAEADAKRWRRTFTDMKNLVDGEEYSFDLKFNHSKGAEFIASLNCIRMDDADNQPVLRITLTDVTKLKQAEDDLLRNETYLSNIFDNEPECIKIVDATGCLKKMNPAGLKMLEADSFEEATSIPLIEFVAPEYQQAFKDLNRRVIAGETLQLQFEIIGLKGNRRWIEIHAVPMQDDNKKLLLGVMRDITARKQAEMSNAKLLAEKTAILDNKMVGMVIARDRKIVWANLAYEIMLGYSKVELIGLPTRQLYLNDEDYQSIGSEYTNIEQEGIVRSEFTFLRKNGQQIWLNLSGTMLNKEQGESLWIFVDVTAQKLAEIATAESHAFLKTVIDAAPIRIFWKDKELRYLGCNLAFAKDAGKASPQDIIGKDDFELTWSAQAELYRADDREVISTGIAKLSYDETQIAPSGQTSWLRTSKIPLKNSNDESIGILGVYEDITESKLAENNLRIASIAFESQEGMMITDSSRNVLRVNQAFTNITGYNADEMIGKNPSLLSSGQHGAAFYDAMWKSINNEGFWEGEIWNKRKNGNVYPEHLTITVVKNEMGIVTNYVATLTDITMSKAAAEEIQYLAFYDSLTKLPNRRLLLDRLNQALVSSARNHISGAILFIDLDHFKTLNDTLGHDIGDLLLQQVAKRLTACVREGDTVARLGGDEYVVMLEHLSENAIEAAAQAEAVGVKILGELSQPYQLASHEYNNTASIGVTVFSNQNQSRDELLKHADIAMYQAKKAGSNTLRFFDPEMQEVIYNRVSLESDLRKAIVNKEFQLYYQVQVDGADYPLGAEALIRWHHPTQGLVSPIKFIQLAEETGLILPIGQWVLDAACTQLKAWEQNEYTRNLTLSINVSAKQFNQADFVMQVQAAVQRHNINPSLLKLELTESMLIDHIDNIIITMVALQSIGVRFELDDFGTGFSSLQYLKKLPIYQLKIDQSFVRDIATDSSDQAIVRTIIVMAQSLNLVVIAEGVETELQRQFLLDNGCNHYQGYLFGRPAPIEEFEALLKSF